MLVIDEEIDMLQEMTYSVQRIREFDELLERGHCERTIYNLHKGNRKLLADK